MKYIILFLMAFGISQANAAPFRCDMSGGVTFADKNQCDAACAGETGQKSCEELDPVPGGAVCDTVKYRGFAAVNGKTFALTKDPVVWGAENTAKIRNAADNKVIAKLLKIFGVRTAWIGAEDRKHSTAYNNIDPSRFVWRDGSALNYSNWRSGEPDNSFDASLIGAASVYGEHWAAVSADGYWEDLGPNADGSERKLPAVVEFPGELSCVSGTAKRTSGAGGAGGGMVCGGAETGGLVPFDKCSEGVIFGSSLTGWLCPRGKTACAETKTKKTKIADYKHDVTLSGIVPGHSNALSMSFKHIDDYLQVYALYDSYWSHEEYKYPVNGKLLSSELLIHYGGVSAPLALGIGVVIDPDVVWSPVAFTLKYSVEEEYWDVNQTCPYPGRPCIESGGGYYCSPDDCTDSSDSGNYEPNPDETPEGSNDADNNGPVDADGNCLGRLVIFTGQDKRCRTVGLQTKGHQCCKIIAAADADKPDIIIFPDALDFDVCNGSERSLAIGRSKDQCVGIGSYCSEKWNIGGCVQRKETFCCFDSDFARAFNEAGMDLLGKNWGTPESPNCGGFSPEELQILSAMNISDHPKMQAYAEKLGAEFGGKLMNEFDKTFKTPEFREDIKNQIEGAKK